MNPPSDHFSRVLFEDFCQRLHQPDESSIGAPAEAVTVDHDSLSLLHRKEFLRSLGVASGSGTGSLKLPSVDDELFGFRLKRELGHGAFARVFLAEQVDLAGRPVVLKVSAILGNEPQTLAQLQHTHIVPIYSLHEDERAGMRAVCMPYFGGATLGQVLQSVWSKGETPSRGEQLVEALASVTDTGRLQIADCRLQISNPQSAICTLQSSRSTHSPLATLRGSTYVHAAVWIVAKLAEALQHAHERGVLHRDIKPSNILLGSDGQPMLLDFNLAHNVHACQAEATLGGTVAYMAPEHLRALASSDPALARKVDQRSDIYSLGMVLYEMLKGHSPFTQSASYAPMTRLVNAMADERSQGVPAGRRLGRSIPWSLESIVRQCLVPDPSRRYQRADELADDLRRFLEDRPLKHAPELSRTERLTKCMRRHPRLTSSGSVASVATVMLLLIGGMLIGLGDRLAAADGRERKQAFEAGTIRALCLVNTTTTVDDHLRKGLSACTETLSLYQVLERDDWQEQRDWLRMNEAERLPLAEDVRELLMLLAWARVRTTPGDHDVLRGALALLDRAEAIQDLTASPALWRDRAFYLGLLGDAAAAEKALDRAAIMSPVSARDHYMLATSYARVSKRSHYVLAVSELDHALRLNPRHYWSLVQRGICQQELGEHALAAADFGHCIGLWPEFAWGYFNRGCVLGQSGKKAEAIRDYTAALERDPGFVLAYVNRGLAYLELKQSPAALADLRKAAELGRDDAFLHAGIGVALEGIGDHAAADQAFANALAQSQASPAQARWRIHWVYGFAVCKRLPEKARAAFAAVLKENPHDPQALYGCAMLWADQGQPELALEAFTKALVASPSFVDARRFRAVLSARRGHWKQAFQDMDWCLAREPESGPTLYAAACVSALAAARSADPLPAQKRAMAYLRQAFDHNYGQDKAASDPDLAGLRSHPEFERLTPSATVKD